MALDFLHVYTIVYSTYYNWKQVYDTNIGVKTGW